MNNKKRIKKVYLKTSNDNYISDVMSNQKEIIAINKADINKLKRDLPDLMYKKGANNKKSLSTMKSNDNLLPSISGNGTTRTTQRIIFTNNKKINNIYKSQHSLSSLSLKCESKLIHNVNTPSNVNRMYSSNNLFLYGNANLFKKENYAPRKVITVKTLIDNNNSSEEPKIDNYKEKTNTINVNTPPQNVNVISPIKSSNLLSFNIIKRYKFANFRRRSLTILPYSSLFPIHSFAYNTHNGNIRSYNEDRISALPLPHNVAYFFAIYDGHGGCGCSSFLQSKLHHYLTSISNSKHIEHSILKCENDFISNHASDTFGNLSGSCALIAMITQDRKIIFVNIGDSRALLLASEYKILFATEDHKQNSPSEQMRIIKAGGSTNQNQMNYELFQNGEILKNGPFRVFPGRLSVSRTIGDAEVKEEKFGGKKGIIYQLLILSSLTIARQSI